MVSAPKGRRRTDRRAGADRISLGISTPKLEKQARRGTDQGQARNRPGPGAEPTKVSSGGSAWEALWRGLKNATKSTHNTTGICDLVPSFEGLPGAQNQHLESVDSGL